MKRWHLRVISIAVKNCKQNIFSFEWRKCLKMTAMAGKRHMTETHELVRRKWTHCFGDEHVVISIEVKRRNGVRCLLTCADSLEDGYSGRHFRIYLPHKCIFPIAVSIHQQTLQNQPNVFCR